MINRYLITLDAPTTAGGKVISASHVDTIDGVPLALEGDRCWCPACQSEGVIRPDGPRLSDTFDGREQALQDDLCICKCDPPPRLVANQALMYQSIDGDWYAGVAGTAAAAAAQSNAAQASPPDTDRLPLALIDVDTDEPFRNCAYRLDLGDRVIEGTTDQRGWTAPLSAAERAAVVAWRVERAAG